MNAEVKFGNTSQSIVTVPSSFLTHDLKPVEIFNLTTKKSYFKEKNLFSQARVLNINNNPIKNYHKYDEYNMKKYIPIHKLSSIPPPENSFNPHYRRDYSLPYNKFFSKNFAGSSNEPKDDNSNALINNFDLFSNLKVDDDSTGDNTRMLLDEPKLNFTQYQVHKRERYNKDYEKYDKAKVKRTRKRLSSTEEKLTKDEKDIPLNTKKPNFSLNTINKASETIQTSMTKKLQPANNLMSRFERDFNTLEGIYQKGNTFDNSNFVKDFRMKLDNLIERINCNYDTKKFMNTDHTSLFNKMNDTMYTPITYYNKNHESETMKFHKTLQEKIKSLNTLSEERKDALLKQFNKTTAHRSEDNAENSKNVLPGVNTQQYFSQSRLYDEQLANTLREDRIRHGLPKINEENLEKMNRENAFLYERYKPSKLFADYPSPTLAEFTKRRGEKYSNRSKEIQRIKNYNDNYRIEIN